MASSQDQTVDGTEDLLIKEGGQTIDRREFIEDPRKDDVAHPPLKTIFPLLLSCGNCKTLSSLGTCFLLQYDLGDVFGEGRDYHYFVTAGHNLVCKTCDRDGEGKMPYREVNIAWEWTPGKLTPDSCICKTITANNDQGWIRVSDKFRTEKIGTNEAFLHDFGVIAVQKSVCLPACTKFFGKFTKECLRALSGQPGGEAANICGYPALVDESVFNTVKPRNYLDLPDSKMEPGKKVVYGLMMWMPPTAGKAASSPSGQETPSDRSDRERSTTAAYGMPQHHHNDDSDKKESSQAKDILYRYYIDTSGGQSGSPVYIVREDGNGDESSYCVGIHVGRWDFSSKELSCNVCFNIDEAIKRMKDEKWADGLKATPSVPAKTNTNDIVIDEDQLKGHSLFGKSPRAAVVTKRSDAENQDALEAKGHSSGAGQKGVSSGGAATSPDFDRSDAGNQDALGAKGGVSGATAAKSGAQAASPAAAAATAKKPPADRSKNPWHTTEYKSMYLDLLDKMDDEDFLAKCFSLGMLAKRKKVAISEVPGSVRRTEMLLSTISTTATNFGKFREILRTDSIKAYADYMDDLDSVGPDPEDPEYQEIRAHLQ